MKKDNWIKRCDDGLKILQLAIVCHPGGKVHTALTFWSHLCFWCGLAVGALGAATLALLV